MMIDMFLKVVLTAFAVIFGSVLIMVLFVVIRELLDERRNHRG